MIYKICHIDHISNCIKSSVARPRKYWIYKLIIAEKTHIFKKIHYETLLIIEIVRAKN